MLDIKFIRENAGAIKKAAKNKNIAVDVDELLKIADERGKLLAEVEELRGKKKQAKKPSEAEIEAGKKLKAELDNKGTALKDLEDEYHSLMRSIPNLHSDDTPIGKDESANVEVRSWGKPRKLDFKPLDHIELGKKDGRLDFERSAKLSGSRFYITVGDFAALEYATARYAFDIVADHGFKLVNPPLMVKKEILEGKGLLSEEEIAQNAFKIDGEDLYLIGTGEIPLTGMHADEILEGKSLPLKYTSFTPCFRREAGTYGKHSKGLFRLHQFYKLEMYQYVAPDKSDSALEEMVTIQEKVVQGLEIPYRVINVATGDMAPYLFKQYDIEYFSPVDNEYRELMSAGNATDFQARRLKIRYKEGDKKELVHTLNATVVALSRALIALVENHQQKDGKIKIPSALSSYMKTDVI